jgi:prepilin-type N-terminal cleavage/methylation domain-containing protein
MNQKKGFTLIELLVVVAIIGLLATLSVVAFNTARAKARDTKRVGDIKQIQTALALYYADNNGYPLTSEIVVGSAIGTNSIIYMNKVPAPPLPSNDGVCPSGATSYVYDSANTNTYTLTYCLGSNTGDLVGGQATATPGTIKQ